MADDRLVDLRDAVTATLEAQLRAERENSDRLAAVLEACRAGERDEATEKAALALHHLLRVSG